MARSNGVQKQSSALISRTNPRRNCHGDSIHTIHISIPIETSDTENENVGSTNMNSLEFALKIAHTHGDTR